MRIDVKEFSKTYKLFTKNFPGADKLNIKQHKHACKLVFYGSMVTISYECIEIKQDCKVQLQSIRQCYNASSAMCKSSSRTGGSSVQWW